MAHLSKKLNCKKYRNRLPSEQIKKQALNFLHKIMIDDKTKQKTHDFFSKTRTSVLNTNISVQWSSINNGPNKICVVKTNDLF